MSENTETGLSFCDWCGRVAALAVVADTPKEAFRKVLHEREEGREPPAKLIRLLADYSFSGDRELLLMHLALMGEIARQERAEHPDETSFVELA